MKGYTHALSGAAAWMGLTSTSVAALGVTVTPVGSYEPTPVICLAGSVICAGAALLPDSDHTRASIAHSLPPVSEWICSLVEAISGGHRHGTHSIIGVVAFGFLAALASLWVVEVEGRTVAVGGGLMAVLLVAFASKVLGLADGIGSQVGGIGKGILSTKLGPWLLAVGTAGAVTWFVDYRWEWLPTAVALGCFMHVIGDFLTPQGVPWLWPLNPAPPKALRPFVGWCWYNNGYFRVPLVGTTKTTKLGDWREFILSTLMSLYVMYIMAYEVFSLIGSPVLR